MILVREFTKILKFPEIVCSNVPLVHWSAKLDLKCAKETKPKCPIVVQG